MQYVERARGGRKKGREKKKKAKNSNGGEYKVFEIIRNSQRKSQDVW